ncbi:hypothetical protein, partial [Leptolyngbya sp. FACHB-541]|uniref:hypothetical protein n=1 Tax=Leptolyngbya sp. FACHB-541 TaxID=2692810 RepID=UPI001A7E7646
LTLLVPAVTGRGSALVGCLASSYLVTVPYSPLFPDRSKESVFEEHSTMIPVLIACNSVTERKQLVFIIVRGGAIAISL